MATYRDQGVARLHLHLVLDRNTTQRFPEKDLVFRGAKPWANPYMESSTMKALRTRSFQLVLHSAFFYCAAPKVGFVFVSASRVAHNHYSVAPMRITSVLEARCLRLCVQPRVFLS